MAVARQAGLPNYTADTSRAIDEHFATQFIDRYYDSAVTSVMSQTDLEASTRITKHGDTVTMNLRPKVRTRSYSVGQEIEFERPGAESIQLVIDKADYLAFLYNRVDLRQFYQDTRWNATKEDGLQEMMLAIEDRFLADGVSDAAAFNRGQNAGRESQNIDLGTTSAPVWVHKEALGSGATKGDGNTMGTAKDIVYFLTQLQQVANEANIPQVGRYCVLPDAAFTQIENSELRQVQVSGDKESMQRKGYIGTIAGFALYSSHRLPKRKDGSDTIFSCYAGIDYAYTFVTQLVYDKDVDLERGFDRGHKRLQVYGYECRKPDALINFHIVVRQ